MDAEKVENRSVWKTVPFLRLFLPLISGLLLEYYTPFSANFLFLFFFLSLIVLTLYNRLPVLIKFHAQWVCGIAVQVIFISLGSVIMHLHLDQPLAESTYYHNSDKNYLIIRIMTEPVQKRSAYKCLARIECLIKNQTCFNQNEKVLIYFSNERFSRKVTGSSWIITDKILQPIENFKSLDFDYKKYCRQRHIYSQLYLKENEYSIVPHTETKSAFTILDSLRKRILTVIKLRVPSTSENSLLEALMVGFTDDLDPVLLKSYADTGVIHIIAISGLHLALICQFLQFVLLPKGKNKSMRWVKLVVMIICLWSYSLLSGASPSVIRAAGMFSLTLFARNILRETTLYNVLAASAFLLLCFDPFWVFDTGFQLSYAAVLSLGLFSKPIRDLLLLKNKILRALWNATSVSMAAQILTTPISIYYFNRFPTYFLAANLFAVPLSSLILAGGIVLCACSPIHPMAQFTGWILGMLIRVLNGFINHLSGLPGAVIGNLRLSLIGVILFYAIIFCSYQFVKYRRKTWFFSGLGILAVFLFIRMIK